MSKRKIILLAIIHAVLAVSAMFFLIYIEAKICDLLDISMLGRNSWLCAIPFTLIMIVDHKIIKRTIPEKSIGIFSAIYSIVPIVVIMALVVYFGSHN